MRFLFFEKAAVGVVVLLLVAVTYPCASADSGEVRSWLGNARSSVDASARLVHSEDEVSGIYALGFDYFNVFATDRGDLGTLIFQPYLVRADAQQGLAGFSVETIDTKVQWRITNFNYTGIGRGRFNVRVGHFELPFGLEQIVQTNGTLNQTNVLSNTGLKTDWGLSLNGELPGLEYEVGFMRGSGNGFKTDANGYFVGRVGLPRHQTWWLGVSGISGELEFQDTPVDLAGIALDGGVRLYNGLHLMLEYTAQEANAVSSSHLFSELGYTSRSEALVTYLQWRFGDTQNILDSRASPRAALGFRYEPTRWWSASAEIRQHPQSAGGSRAYVFQFRFRT